MAASSKISLVVGFPQAQSPRDLAKLHRKFKIRQDEKVDFINGYTIDVPESKLDEYVSALPESASVMIDEPFFNRETPVVAKPGRSIENEFSDEAVEIEEPYISRPAGLAELHAQGIQGQGTTIAVIDSGIAKHADLKDRIKFFKDFSSKRTKSPIDPYGHGTHVAGIAAGDGDLIDGIAPKAELVGLRIKSPLQAIKALEWAVENKDKYDIDVLNISLGVPDRLPSRKDPFAQAAQQAIDAGIITVVAAGNEGNDCNIDAGTRDGGCQGTISSPGTLPDAITVGAYHDKGTSKLSDDHVWFKTSVGPTAVDGSSKPDLVAQGVHILAPKSSGSHMAKTRPTWTTYHSDDGSSMATPMVSGAAALLLQVDPTLTQAEVKEILTDTATPIKKTSKHAQGAGRLNLAKAIAEAQATA